MNVHVQFSVPIPHVSPFRRSPPPPLSKVIKGVGLLLLPDELDASLSLFKTFYTKMHLRMFLAVTAQPIGLESGQLVNQGRTEATDPAGLTSTAPTL